MDLEDQWKLSRLMEEHGDCRLTVLIGCPDAESSQIQAETVSTGDPSLSGVLTDRPLRLHVAHVAEQEARQIFPLPVFQKYIEPFLARVDIEAIVQRMREVRHMADDPTATSRRHRPV